MGGLSPKQAIDQGFLPSHLSVLLVLPYNRHILCPNILLAYKVAAGDFIVKHTFTPLGFCYLFYEFNEELLACAVKLSIL